MFQITKIDFDVHTFIILVILLKRYLNHSIHFIRLNHILDVYDF